MYMQIFENIKEMIPYSTIMWSEIGQQNVQVEKVYQVHVLMFSRSEKTIWDLAVGERDRIENHSNKGIFKLSLPPSER